MTGPVFADFCENPWQAICDHQPTHRTEVLRSIREKSASDVLEIPSAFTNFKNVNLPIIKLNLKRAVEQAKLNNEAQTSFYNYINKANFTAPHEIRSSENHELQYRADRLCLGDRPTAQAEDSEETRKTGLQTIIMCDENFLFQPPLGRTFFVAAHELSHIMSFPWEPALYKNLLNCVSERNGNQILAEYLEGFTRPEEESYRQEISRMKPRLVRAHMYELTSDYWAKKAIGEFFKNEGKDWSAEEKLLFLQQAFGYFCDTPDNGEHPSGRFRIEFMGFDPQIRAALQCKNPASQVSCDLR